MILQPAGSRFKNWLNKGRSSSVVFIFVLESVDKHSNKNFFALIGTVLEDEEEGGGGGEKVDDEEL